ncbi:MAG: hypothetical protein AAB152_10705 [Candidatus Coatesbacteria bacterium]
MDPVAVFLLSAAGILLVGALGELVFRRTGFPDVLWLMLGGFCLGPWLGVATPSALDPAVPYFASLALAVVVFETGSRCRIAELAGPHRRAAVLGILAFASSVLAVAAVAMLAVTMHWLPADWDWRRALLLGAILGGASSTVFLPALLRARVDLKAASVASLESATGETLAIVAACALAVPGPVRAFGSALAIGIIAGLVWLLFLKTVRATNHAYSITLGLLLCLSVGVERAGGVPAMAVLGAALVLGNAPAISRGLKLNDVLDLGEDVRGYHSQLAFLIKAFFFVFLGTRLGPPWGPVAIGAGLAVVALAARRPAVALVTGEGSPVAASRPVLNACMPRGLVAGVLGALAWSRWVPGDPALPGLVAGCVFASVALFAVVFPLSTRAVETAPSSAIGPAPAVAAPSPLPVAPSPVVPPPVMAEDLWATPVPTPPPPPRPAPAPVPPAPAWVPPAIPPRPPSMAPLTARPAAPKPVVSAPARPEEIIAVAPADPDIKPGSGFRW